MKKNNVFRQSNRINEPCLVILFISAVLCFFNALPCQGQSPRDAVYFYNEGRDAMFREDWYAAIEDLLECLRQNPAHAEGAASLAECYYSLGEYDQALVWVRKARSLARLNMETANLEAFILIANGRLDEAAEIIKYVQSREPYNRNALFTAAELEVARGKPGDAVRLFREAVRRYPDDRRILISLALVLGSLGDTEAAREYIERAEVKYPDDYRVYYYAAYLASRAGRVNAAIQDVQRALRLRPDFIPAVSLLASLLYRNGEYEEAAALADRVIAARHDDTSAWLLKGMAYSGMGRESEAVTILEKALGFDSEDEFIRTALENIVIESTRLEDPLRERWANYHFERARAYRLRNLSAEALFEYRRGLRINPYAKERLDYAETLRLLGYPELYLEELIFLRDAGMDNQSIEDKIETYTALMSGSLAKRWNVEPAELRPHWNIAIFSAASQSAFYHTDAGYITSQYIKDILIHDSNINTPDFETRQQSFASAFRTAREGNNMQDAFSPSVPDYFLLVNVLENERDIAVNAELYVARTGARAGSFNVYRTGADRLRNAARGIVEQLGQAMPFRAVLLRRAAGEGLIDKGRMDGCRDDVVYQIVRKGRVDVRSEGIGLQYAEGDITGSFTPNQLGEELTSGTISRAGFFDLVAVGDEVVAKEDAGQSGGATGGASAAAADPELRAILRTLR
ncbi:MAG: tetratricopeptide repeat protein [Spirochaetaceae bacterium]|jgi:tetratricopeptide (TPR) repeat protein|nr:tetratricopeptide repeat protein [Spirochaetaceae bacterium]